MLNPLQEGEEAPIPRLRADDPTSVLGMMLPAGTTGCYSFKDLWAKLESQKFEENEEYLHKHEVGKAIKQNSQTITHKEKYGYISLHKNIKLLCNKRHINKV